MWALRCASVHNYLKIDKQIIVCCTCKVLERFKNDRIIVKTGLA